MHVGGIHFINHKINYYVPEGVALLNLPVSTLKQKRAIIRNYFRVINITINKTIIRNNQPAHDVPGTSLEGPQKILTSSTYKGPSGDSQGTNTKIDDLMKKLFLRSGITYQFLFFTGTTNIQKF